MSQVPRNMYAFTDNGLAATRIKGLASQLATAGDPLRVGRYWLHTEQFRFPI